MSTIASYLAAGDRPPLSMREAFWGALVDLAASDPQILVVDADVASSTRADLFESAYPARFLEMGIAEQNLFGVAAGLAAMGYIPYSSAFACFSVARALDQIWVLIDQPRLPVRIVGSYAGVLTAMTGKTHHAIEDVAVMRALPGMVVIAPADASEAARAVEATLDVTGPVYIRIARNPSPQIFDRSRGFIVGQAECLRAGRDVSLISTGTETARVLEAAAYLEAASIHAYVLHVPTLKPLDVAAIVDAAEASNLVVTVEEHSIIGGLGSAVAEILSELRPTKILRLGIRDVYCESAPDDALLEKYRLAGMCVAEDVLEALGVKGEAGEGRATGAGSIGTGSELRV